MLQYEWMVGRYMYLLLARKIPSASQPKAEYIYLAPIGQVKGRLLTNEMPRALTLQ